MKVKIYGAGSIGNHLSNASRACGWSVDLVDSDPSALERTRTKIYPERYGVWDESIRLFESKNAPVGGYDLVMIGTPPESHVSLALSAVKERPRAILVEKPFCTPDMKQAQELHDLARENNIPIFTGYDHVVGQASEKFSELIHGVGEIETLDVEFREYWGGIFAAHPWLDGPSDSYLGFWNRAGGACSEHSHGINLWQHFAHVMGAGRVTEITGTLSYVSNENVEYDNLAFINLKTENGLVGRVVQDVVTSPPRKWARLQGSEGYVELQCGYKAGVDAVFSGSSKAGAAEYMFPKTRPDDFIHELRHIASHVGSNLGPSPISIERGLETALLIAAAHLSSREKRTVSIDYSAGYSLNALK